MTAFDDRPLEGVRVLDLTQNLPGPYATSILRSMGAEVIKVEPPRGDPARAFGHLFEIVNAGKKSVVLDLMEVAHRKALGDLIADADVLVEGFRPGVMERFGWGATAAMDKNPRLVYCSISGFGQDGPYRDYPGHDLNYQALVGVCDMTRDDRDRPAGAALPIADLSSSLTAVSGITAALLARTKSGRGRAIDVAMVDAVFSWTYVWGRGLSPGETRPSAALRVAASALDGAASKVPAPIGALFETVARSLRAPMVAEGADKLGERMQERGPLQRLARQRLYALPNYALYRTRDTRWISVAIVDEQKFWRALCEGIGVSPLGTIPWVGRLAAAKPLRRILATVFARRDLEEWLRILDREKIPVSPVLTLDDALEDPQLRSRRPATGHVRGPHPISPIIEAAAPELGEHTEQILGALASGAAWGMSAGPSD